MMAGLLNRNPRYAHLVAGHVPAFCVLTIICLGPMVAGIVLFQVCSPDPRFLTVAAAGLVGGTIIAAIKARKLDPALRARDASSWAVMLYAIEIGVTLGLLLWLVRPLKLASVSVGGEDLTVMTREVKSLSDGVYLIEPSGSSPGTRIPARWRADNMGGSFLVESSSGKPAALRPNELSEVPDEIVFPLTVATFFVGPKLPAIDGLMK